MVLMRNCLIIMLIVTQTSKASYTLPLALGSSSCIAAGATYGLVRTGSWLYPAPDGVCAKVAASTFGMCAGIAWNGFLTQNIGHRVALCASISLFGAVLGLQYAQRKYLRRKPLAEIKQMVNSDEGYIIEGSLPVKPPYTDGIIDGVKRDEEAECARVKKNVHYLLQSKAFLDFQKSTQIMDYIKEKFVNHYALPFIILEVSSADKTSGRMTLIQRVGDKLKMQHCKRVRGPICLSTDDKDSFIHEFFLKIPNNYKLFKLYAEKTIGNNCVWQNWDIHDFIENNSFTLRCSGESCKGKTQDDKIFMEIGLIYIEDNDGEIVDYILQKRFGYGEDGTLMPS